MFIELSFMTVRLARAAALEEVDGLLALIGRLPDEVNEAKAGNSVAKACLSAPYALERLEAIYSFPRIMDQLSRLPSGSGFIGKRRTLLAYTATCTTSFAAILVKGWQQHATGSPKPGGPRKRQKGPSALAIAELVEACAKAAQAWAKVAIFNVQHLRDCLLREDVGRARDLMVGAAKELGIPERGVWAAWESLEVQALARWLSDCQKGWPLKADAARAEVAAWQFMAEWELFA